MRPLAVLAVLVLLPGCTQSPTEAGAVPSDCRYPNVDPGSNAYIVGVVWKAGGEVLNQVEVRAQPIGSGNVVLDTTNDSGCFFLSVEGGTHYDVQFTKPGYRTAELKDQTAATGEKVVRSVTLTAQ